MRQDATERAALEILLLGRFDVRVEGAPVDPKAWVRRKPQQLVKVLALHPGHRLHREQLADALWPDLEREAALAQLSKAVSYARRALEPGRGARAGSRFLEADRNEVWLGAPSGVRVDAAAFRAEARAALSGRDAAGAAAALALYRGDLLPSDLYEPWAAVPREDLRALRGDLMYALASWQAAAHDGAGAAATLADLLLSEPAHEDAHVLLMRVHQRAGDVARAMRQYERCREALARELDAEPGPAARALLAELAAAPPARDAVAPPAEAEVPAAAPPPEPAAEPAPTAPAGDGAPANAPARPPDMRHVWRRGYAAAAALVLAAGLAAGSLAASTPRLHRKVSRAMAAAQMRLAELRGEPRRIVSLQGVVEWPGARVDVADSVSGWGAIADEAGRFTIADVGWYPGVEYTVVVTAGSVEPRRFDVRAPSASDAGVVDVGALAVTGSAPARRADLDLLTSTHRIRFDEPNAPYYEGVVAAVTAGVQGDQARVGALARFVGSLNRPGAGPLGEVAPRVVIEHGSSFSSDLSRALATLARAAGYDARVINVLSPAPARQPLMIVEVRYGGSWHVYDPTFGVEFAGAGGRVPSYQEVLLAPGALDASAPRYVARPLPAWYASALLSGIHHWYQFEEPGPVV